MLKEGFILKHVIHAKQSGNAITTLIEQFKIVICVIKGGEMGMIQMPVLR